MRQDVDEVERSCCSEIKLTVLRYARHRSREREELKHDRAQVMMRIVEVLANVFIVGGLPLFTSQVQ